MLVKPNAAAGAIQALAETRLLFLTKDVHLVEAEIGDFLQDCYDALKAFRAGNDKFWHDYSDVKSQLTAITTKITKSKSVPAGMLDHLFPGKNAAERAIKAISQMVTTPSLYAEIGGNVLSPSSQIPLEDAHLLFQQVIQLGNKHGWSPADHAQFEAAVVKHCSTSDGVWDFTRAETPFTDILTVHPAQGTQAFTDKIEHVRRVLNWSDNRSKGYCWATWGVYMHHIDWLNQTEREGLIASVETMKAGQGCVDTDARRWLEVLRDDAATSAPLKARIHALLS